MRSQAKTKKPRQRTLTEPRRKGKTKMQINTTTTTAQSQSLVWLVDYSGELVNETRTGTRSADGRYLKRNCKLNAKRRTSDFNEMLADEAFNAA